MYCICQSKQLLSISAIRELQEAQEREQNSRRVQETLSKAQKLQKQSKKRDYYKILGVKRSVWLKCTKYVVIGYLFFYIYIFYNQEKVLIKCRLVFSLVCSQIHTVCSMQSKENVLCRVYSNFLYLHLSALCIKLQQANTVMCTIVWGNQCVANCFRLVRAENQPWTLVVRCL